jgi:hypothetical protein
MASEQSTPTPEPAAAANITPLRKPELPRPPMDTACVVALFNAPASGPRLNLPAGRDYFGGYGRFDNRG